MKYMLLIHNRPGYVDRLPEADRAELIDQVETIMKELSASGELIRGEALADPSQTRTVRVRDGLPAVTNGPFIATAEQFAGYLLVDCDTPERAIEIATGWPDARHYAMEVRPVTHQSGPQA